MSDIGFGRKGHDVDVRTNVLSLCAGGGGLDLGVDLALRDARTVCYVENEVTAAAVLVANMEAQRLPAAPLWTDLRTFDGSAWRGVVDLIIGGYPCQPFSVAGKRLGTADPRHLWPDVRRIVGEVQPRDCFFENVGAHLRLGFYEVARDLQDMGYRVAAVLLTAEEIGAPHGRERLFIMAHHTVVLQREQDDAERAESWGDARSDASGNSGTVDDAAGARLDGRERGTDWPLRDEGGRAESRGRCDGWRLADASSVPGEVPASSGAGGAGRGVVVGAGRDGSGEGVALGDTDEPRLEGWCEPIFSRGDELPTWPPGPEDADAWRRVLAIRPDLAPALEPGVRGVADGMARGLGYSEMDGLARSDQLHVLGNGVVPAQAAYAWHLLTEALDA